MGRNSKISTSLLHIRGAQLACGSVATSLLCIRGAQLACGSVATSLLCIRGASFGLWPQVIGYVRMFDGLYTAPDDNPTIGLILCTEKCDTVARYSVLNDRKQIFASKYLPNLPSEEQLRREIERERRLIEAALDEREQLDNGEES